MAMDAEIGKEVCHRTPYAKIEMLMDWQKQIEEDTASTLWYFRGASLRVGKSYRFPVLVTRLVEKWERDPKTGKDVKVTRPQTFRDWILVGYEGSGGY